MRTLGLGRAGQGKGVSCVRKGKGVCPQTACDFVGDPIPNITLTALNHESCSEKL